MEVNERKGEPFRTEGAVHARNQIKFTCSDASLRVHSTMTRIMVYSNPRSGTVAFAALPLETYTIFDIWFVEPAAGVEPATF